MGRQQQQWLMGWKQGAMGRGMGWLPDSNHYPTIYDPAPVLPLPAPASMACGLEWQGPQGWWGPEEWHGWQGLWGDENCEDNDNQDIQDQTRMGRTRMGTAGTMTMTMTNERDKPWVVGGNEPGQTTGSRGHHHHCEQMKGANTWGQVQWGQETWKQLTQPLPWATTLGGGLPCEKYKVFLFLSVITFVAPHIMLQGIVKY